MKAKGGGGRQAVMALKGKTAAVFATVGLLSLLSGAVVTGWGWGADDVLPASPRPLPSHEPQQRRSGTGAAGDEQASSAKSRPPLPSVSEAARPTRRAGSRVREYPAAVPGGKAEDVMWTGRLQQHTDGTGDAANLHNGVVLILYGGRFGGHYFVKYALPRMEAHLFRCHPYPLHVFYEKGDEGDLEGIRRLVPSTNVTFEEISFATLPHGVSEGDVDRWRKEGAQKKFQGRGYRQMCRFWFGVVWTLPSLRRYDYYLRLDTDSIVPDVVPADPFRKMAAQGCDYGFNRLKGENPFVTTGLWETAQRWMDADPLVTAAARKRVEDVALKKGEYWGPMYYNNFELGTFALKNSAVYQAFFRHVDRQKPHGIFRYRWGDAPLHTLAVAAAVERPDAYCNYTRKEFPYQHNPDKKDVKKKPVAAELPSCPPRPPN